jgi:hypothetical protein
MTDMHVTKNEVFKKSTIHSIAFILPNSMLKYSCYSTRLKLRNTHNYRELIYNENIKNKEQISVHILIYKQLDFFAITYKYI